MRNSRTIKWLSLLTGLGLNAYVTPANAAVDEYSIILLDRTGSMIENTNINIPSQTFWTDAMDSAVGVISLKDYDHTINRAYAIWDFRNGAYTSGDTTQVSAKQVWPLAQADCSSFCPAGSPGCATFISPTTTTGLVSNYCDFSQPNAGSDTPYTGLANLLLSYKTDPNRMPDPTGNGTTPLADSVCRILDQIRETSPTAQQTITLESDGGENDSSATGVCGNWSVASTNANFVGNTNFGWNKNVPDWDMSAAKLSGAPDAVDSTIFPGGGSWEARIVRRAIRMNIPAAADATKTALGNESSVRNLAWRVDAHYKLYTSSSLSPLAVAAPAATTLSARGDSVSGGLDTLRQHPVNAMVAGLAAPGTAAATTTVTLSITQSDLSLFKQLGSTNFPTNAKAKARSYFQAVAVDQNQVYGTYHKLAGDVDDSNCVDRADYSIMTQKDVWRQRALPPNQIGMRADLNKDGWTNEADRTILLANWGKGCINNPGPKPVVK